MRTPLLGEGCISPPLLLFIHKYMPIYVHTCKCKIYPDAERFLFLSSNLSCAIQLTCAVFEARLKNKILTCYNEQPYGLRTTGAGREGYKRAEMTLGSSSEMH